MINGSLVAQADDKSSKIIIVGAGASGIAAASKLLEYGYNNIVVLEALDRIGGRVHSIPFGKGFVDLGAQWCSGQEGNVVYELANNHFEFGDNDIRNDNMHCYRSDGTFVEQKQYEKVMDLSESIVFDYENMVKFNGSLGEFFETNYRNRIRDKEFEDVDQELSDQVIELTEKRMNSLYASDSWYDLSSQLNGFEEGASKIHSCTSE